jgi:hypothetical protein
MEKWRVIALKSMQNVVFKIGTYYILWFLWYIVYLCHKTSGTTCRLTQHYIWEDLNAWVNCGKNFFIVCRSKLLLLVVLLSPPPLFEMYVLCKFWNAHLLAQYKFEFSSVCPVHKCNISCRLCLRRMYLHMRFTMSSPSLRIYLLFEFVMFVLPASHLRMCCNGI